MRRKAEKSNPPLENSKSDKFDLVEIKNIDKSIKYDIRYASENNFMGVNSIKQVTHFFKDQQQKHLKELMKN